MLQTGLYDGRLADGLRVVRVQRVIPENFQPEELRVDDFDDPHLVKAVCRQRWKQITIKTCIRGISLSLDKLSLSATRRIMYILVCVILRVALLHSLLRVVKTSLIYKVKIRVL